tara:strand:+ start:426 stop:740 length:315 start_codon:yes stop_codon:yes gene_type:complete
MKKIILLIFILSFVSACQATKDALTLQKKNTSDEFLVEKKNPLVLPPDYGQLPVPKDINNDKKDSDKSKTILSLSKENFSKKKIKKDSELSSIEKSIMEKIKKK